MKLSKPALLRTFMPEHGAKAKELLHRIILIKPVLYICPDN
jgi:hypothetical protein